MGVNNLKYTFKIIHFIKECNKKSENQDDFRF
jgi:hypothetical protein